MTAADPDCVAFGPFRFFPRERRLLNGQTPVAVGSRALDILIVLIEQAGEVVSKRALMARVWPDTTVGESSLRVHIAGLRRALGESGATARFIANVTGRGYSFVGRIESRALSPVRPPPPRDPAGALPRRATRMVGRENDLGAIRDLLAARRFVTIHGAGGIGKTTVGLAVAESVLGAHADGVRFIDLGMRPPGASAADALAATLGLFVQRQDATPNILAWLRGRRMLLVLDCCEHVIESAAALAEAIHREAPHVAILATSREPLRAEGEHVHSLAPLAAPPEGELRDVAELLRYPAALLFHDRVVASGQPGFADADVPIVAAICRKVDGIALALELAAGRVAAHGLRETAALLESRFNLTWRGRRTAPPRQQTLNATMDWSYNLISAQERAVLRRLAVFVGPFTLEAARAVAADEAIDEGHLIEAIEQLVDKSLVLAVVSAPVARYRLLDPTRAYAGARLEEHGEEAAIARRHAAWYRAVLAGLNAQGDAQSLTREDLANVHAALEWCFSAAGDAALGIALAAEACGAFFELTLLRECRAWAERALAALAADPETGAADRRAEMALLTALGHALMFSHGNAAGARPAFERALALAQAQGDQASQFRLLAGLHMHYRRAGQFAQLLPLARQAEAKARELATPPAIAAASAMLGVTHHLLGHLGAARAALAAALRQPAGERAFTTNGFGFNRDTHVLLARNLWLQGYSDQAMATARDSERMARHDPVSQCLGLIWTMSLHHWGGAWRELEALVERLIPYASEHSLEPYKWVGMGFRGEMLVWRGETAAGVAQMRQAFNALQAEGYAFNTRWLGGSLANGLSVLGRIDQALATMDLALAAAEDSGAYNLADLWRIHGDILVRAGDSAAAQRRYQAAIALADDTGALAWRLRAATSFARLRLRQGRREEARSILADTYGRFTEGFHTADLRAARMLLDDIERCV